LSGTGFPNQFLGISRHLKVYPADVQTRPFPSAAVPDNPSMAAEDMLADATWQDISWRTGTKGKLKAPFAAVRVRVAAGTASLYVCHLRIE